MCFSLDNITMAALLWLTFNNIAIVLVEKGKDHDVDQ